MIDDRIPEQLKADGDEPDDDGLLRCPQCGYTATYESFNVRGADEVSQALRLYRAGWSYQRIADHLGRNVASVGYVIRREDMREESRICAEEGEG